MLSRLFKLRSINWWIIAGVSLIALVIQTLPLVQTRFLRTGDFLVTSAHDSLWHLSLINELNRNFPPQHPSFSGYSLENYHYASDVFWTFLIEISGLEPWIVYYRLAPFIGAGLFIISSIIWVKQWVKRFTNQLVALILIWFGGSYGYLAWLWHLASAPKGNIFMLDQPVEMQTNVHTYLGFSLFIGTLTLIKIGSQQRRPKLLFLSGLIIGLTYVVKAYASLTLGLSVILTWIFQCLLTRRINNFIWIVIPAVLLLMWFVLPVSTQNQGLIWSPGWILQKMVADGDRLNGLQSSAFRLEAYQQTESYIKYYLLLGGLSTIYLMGNLGARAMSLVVIWRWINRYNQLSANKWLLTIIMLVSLGLPLLFRQGATPYNVIQFGQYGLLIGSLLTGIYLDNLSPQIARKIGSLIVFLAIPTTIYWIYDVTQLHLGSYVVSQEQVHSLKFLATQTPVESIVLTDPDTVHSYLMLIPGLGQRQAYYSGEVFGELTGLVVKNRAETSREFFADTTSIQDKIAFIDQANINYIYLDEESSELAFHQTLFELPLKLVYNNQIVQIYQVIR